MEGKTLTTSLRETLALFPRGGTPLTTTEVAERLDLGRRSTYDRLDRLVDHEQLETKKVGASARVWWRPSRAENHDEWGETGDWPAAAEALVDAVEEYAIFTLDTAGRVRSWNSGAERLQGYEADDVLGEHVSTFYTDAARDDDVPESTLSTATATGSVRTEGWRVRADGTRFWASETVTALHDDEGSHTGYAIVTRDMTDAQTRERAARRERAFLERVLETSPIGIGIFADSGESRRVNARFAELLGYDPDDAGDYTLGERPIRDDDGAVVPFSDRPAAAALATGEAVVDRRVRVDDPDGETRWLSVNAEPFDDGEKVVVTLTDVTKLTERTRRLERQRDDVQSELENVIDRVDDVLYVVDDEFRFTYVNDRAQAALEAREVELLDRVIWDVLSIPPGSPIRERFETAMATGEATTFERRSDRRDVWEEIRLYPSDDGLTVYFRDVTERKERQKQLERYGGIVDAVNESVYELDENGRMTFVNDAFLEYVGYEESEVLGEHVSMVMDEDDIAGAESLIASLLETDASERSTLEFTLVDRQGDRIPVENRFSILTDDEGEFRGTAGILRDVTDRKERERELERYETIVETLDDGIYAVDDDSRFLLVNEGFCELTGYDRETLLGAPADTVYDDRHTSRVEALADAVAAGEQDVAMIDLDIETRSGDAVACETRFAPLSMNDDLGRCGVVRDISARLEREQRLRRRVRQQDVVTRLGQRALDEHDVETLVADAVRLVADTLDVDYCAALDLGPEAETLAVRQGVGWDDGIVGSATVSAVETDSLAARTLAAAEPIAVEDLRADARFDGPALLTGHDVASGVSTAVGPSDDPWGVLGAYDTDRRSFSDHEVNFVQSVANIVASAIDRRRDRRALVRQRERLAALNGLNGAVNEITEAIIAESTREQIEETVCERLADAGAYEFAWIGDVDVGSRTVDYRTGAGFEGRPTDGPIDLGGEDEPADGPTARAFRTGEIQTTSDAFDGASPESGRRHGEAPDVRSSAAVPIVHEDTVYGVLNVYATRPNAFEGEERSVMAQLGEIVGHAIVATERKRALLSDEVIELEFQIDDIFEGRDIDATSTGRIDLQHLVPIDHGEFFVYGTQSPDAAGTLEALVESVPHWANVRTADDGRFEVRLSDPPIMTALTSVSGTVAEAVIEDGEYRMRFHLPPSADVRRVIEAVETTYPAAAMVKRQQLARPQDGSRDFTSVLTDLTERQRTALDVAYHSGYFEWPRTVSGEDIAESLDVAPPTFHQHLRKAEKTVLGSLLTATTEAT